MSKHEIKESSLVALYEPQAEPNAHRAPAEYPGGEAQIKSGRRPSVLEVVNNLRPVLAIGATTLSGRIRHNERTFNHWLLTEHLMQRQNGEIISLAITLANAKPLKPWCIYWKSTESVLLSELIGEFGGENREIAAEGITQDEDLWPRFALKWQPAVAKPKS